MSRPAGLNSHSAKVRRSQIGSLKQVQKGVVSALCNIRVIHIILQQILIGLSNSHEYILFFPPEISMGEIENILL